MNERVTLRTRPRPSVVRDGSAGAGPAVAPSGWLNVEAPFDVELREGETALGT